MECGVRIAIVLCERRRAALDRCLAWCCRARQRRVQGPPGGGGGAGQSPSGPRVSAHRAQRLCRLRRHAHERHEDARHAEVPGQQLGGRYGGGGGAIQGVGGAGGGCKGWAGGWCRAWGTGAAGGTGPARRARAACVQWPCKRPPTHAHHLPPAVVLGALAPSRGAPLHGGRHCCAAAAALVHYQRPKTGQDVACIARQMVVTCIPDCSAPRSLPLHPTVRGLRGWGANGMPEQLHKLVYRLHLCLAYRYLQLSHFAARVALDCAWLAPRGRARCA